MTSPSLVLLLVVLAFAFAVGDCRRTVRQIHVIHRHGARTIGAPDNASTVCGPLGCGILTAVGGQMGHAVGRYLRQEYPDLLGRGYHPTRVVSKSTSSLRALQTAAALLHGAFDNTTAPRAVPYDTGAPQFAIGEAEDLLTSGPLPSYYMPSAAGFRPGYPEPPASLWLLSNEAMAAIAVETMQDRHCGRPQDLKPWDRLHCVTWFNDFLHCHRAAGDLETRFPVVAKYGPIINQIHVDKFKTQFQWRRPGETNVVRRLRGSGLAPLANTIADTLVARAKAGPGVLPDNYDSPGSGPPARVYHWSGHDVTIAPLATAFGLGNATMNVPFTATFIVELIEEVLDAPTKTSTSTEASEAAVSWSVAVKYGFPGQTLQTAAAVPPSGPGAFKPQPIGCAPNMTDAGLGVRVVPGALCPLGDFARYVAATKPQSPLSECYVPESVLKALDCTMVGVKARPTNGACIRYRRQCGDAACPSGTTLLVDGWRCVDTSNIR